MIKSILSDFRILYSSLPRRRRRQFLLLLVLMLVGALAEIVTLGAIIPFLGILSDPDYAIQQPIIAKLIDMLGLGTGNVLRLQLTLLFCITAIVAGIVRFLLIYVTSRVNFGMVHELGSEVYRRTLYQTYDVHVQRNSSEIIGAIGKVDVVSWASLLLLNAFSALLMATAIIVTLLYFDPLVAIVALFGLGLVYATFSIVTRKRLNRNSEVINDAFGKRVKAVQEGMGGVRDIILDHSQTLFLDRFKRVDLRMRRSQASNAIIDPSPRFGVEALGMVLIAFLAYGLTVRDGSLASSLPVLGAIALGAQRLMPLIQQMYRGYVYLVGNHEVIHDVANQLQQPVAKEQEIAVEVRPFEKSIDLDGVTFRYHPDAPDVVRNVNLSINKGAKVGFVGETGCGKSTLLDLVMGLLQPTQGRFLVDGVPVEGTARLGWQQNIAHVPQSIYLRDASFSENIAFGISTDHIDHERVKRAAAAAQIAEFIENNPGGYAGMVGERGVRLSGGQRQRVGIARALYKSCPVLVLDEATSALDVETETAVIKSVLELNPDLTVLMIAHRMSTLDECDLIVEIRDGKVQSTKQNIQLGTR